MAGGLHYLLVVVDRRGPGLRRSFGPFQAGAGRAQTQAEKINEAARAEGPTLDDGEPAIRAYVSWLHSGKAATIANTVLDAPHPETGQRPSELAELEAQEERRAGTDDVVSRVGETA